MKNRDTSLLFLLIVFSVALFGQSSPTVKIFQKSTSGIVSDTVLAVAVDNRGIYWVASQVGPGSSSVGSYNGSEWNYPSSLSNLNFMVYSLASAPDGSLWLATSKGIMQYKESALTQFTKTNTPIFKTDSFESIVTDKNNRIYAGNSNNGLLVYSNSAWKEYNTYYSSVNGSMLGNVSGVGLEGITVTVSGNVYCFGTLLPILTFKNDSLFAAGLPLNNLTQFSATAINESPNGELWYSYISSGSRGIVKVANSVTTIYDSTYFKSSTVFSDYNSILFSANSKPWIGLYHGGLLTFDAGNSTIKYDFFADSVYQTTLFSIDKNDNKVLTAKVKDSNGNYVYKGLVFYNEAGVTIPLNNDEYQNSPLGFTLSQNYPNPFNPSTSIDFEVPKSGMVTLKVYDVLGGEIMTLVNEMKVVGKHSISFDAGNLPSGVYFYKLQSGDFVSTKKMVLVK